MSTQTAKKTIWQVDPAHSEFVFKVRHMMISTVTGHFNAFQVDVESDGNDFNDAEIGVKIEVDSISTKQTDRDNHLKSDDFFNAEQYPQITFNSKSFKGEKLIGNITIRDITKEIELDVAFHGTAIDQYGQSKAGFEINGEINRKDFNLNWNAITEAGNVVVSDKVQLALHVQLIKR